MQCRNFREVVDSYLCDELSIDKNHEVLTHLENCSDCRRELAARRELRATLRTAATKAAESQLDPQFASRLHAQLRATALQGHDVRERRSPFAVSRGWLALAACLLVAFGLGMMVVRQRGLSPAGRSIASHDLNSTDANADSAASQAHPTDERVKVSWEELTTLSVGDHRNCAVKFNLPEKPLELEAAARKYHSAYVALGQKVKERVSESPDMEFIDAHWCVFQGKRFAHIELKQHGRLVSLLVTDFEAAGSATRSIQAGTRNDVQVIACSQNDGYQVSCFETARHAVFVISDLSETDNLNIARALAPVIYQHLSRAESIA